MQPVCVSDAHAGICPLNLSCESTLMSPPSRIADTNTFFTGNVGAGVKWYSGRWGLRGDYRFIGVRSKDDAPDFFGRDNRYGHRVYGGVLLNVAR